MDGNTHQRVHRQEASVRIEALEGRQLLTAAVTGLTLINANTGRVIEALDYGDTIDLARTGARLSVRADAVEAESVRFSFDGDPDFGVDSSAPYSIGGGRGRGRRDQAWTPTVGTHTLVVTPYAEDGGEGAPGASRMVVFNIIDSRGHRGRGYVPPVRGGAGVRRPGPPVSAPTVPGPLYVNAGGATFTDSLGRVFQGDTGFTGGFTGSSTADVANTLDDALYQSYRAGSRFTFAYPVANGNYSLWLHFAEPTATQVGQRRFDVTAEAALALDDYDVFAAAGGANAAVAEAIDVSITDNRLDLSFTAVAGDAILSGITLVPTDLPLEVKAYDLSCYAAEFPEAVEAARRVRSASNLRQIGQAIFLYANDHKGRIPPDLETLVEYELEPYVFAGPRTGTLLPRGETTELEQRAWARLREDFIYVSDHPNPRRLDADDIIAYENPDRVHGPINVLFGDGHVELLERAVAAERIGFPDAPPSDPPPLPPAADDPACEHRDLNVAPSAGNLRDIAVALQLYGNENKGVYPVNLGTLFSVSRLGLDTFINPRGNTSAPSPDLSPEQQIAWVNASTDYSYIRGRNVNPGDTVVAYENPSEMKDGINILFNDGHVEFREMRWAIETLRRAGVSGVA